MKDKDIFKIRSVPRPKRTKQQMRAMLERKRKETADAIKILRMRRRRRELEKRKSLARLITLIINELKEKGLLK